ncbi:protein phosphatase CheZ [Stappia sp. ES.058]|uniref:protein phosphatase CheZ n=1 Tax=Stappia sp. ES.058 TaxID=1881061 RepID=UPI00087AF509|nr:protein phosphatase CheZ [Stappia sp. ES.058]SDU25309.1 Chemotaxis regulator CheZ, phosphatase of CheY~P [Stappia sp. ES.058]
MAENSTPGATMESDYDAILTALTETDRGRWFLDEYMRRHQKPDTQVVLDAIGRLEKAMVRERKVPDLNSIRLDIADMQEAIERTKREIANIKHEAEDNNRFIEASNELDAIVTKTESATQEILAAAEAIQEHAWTLREAGAEESACDEIDARATEIFMACSFQDLTGQRTQKIVQVLQYLESRINLMISIWGIEGAKGENHALVEDSRPDAHLLNGPQLDGRGVNQDAVDEMFGPGSSAADDEGDDAQMNAQDKADAAFSGTTAEAHEIDALFASDAAEDGDIAWNTDAEDAPEEEADVFARAEADDPAPDNAASGNLPDLAGVSDEDLGEADVFERASAPASDDEAPSDDDVPTSLLDDIVMVDADEEKKWAEDAAGDASADPLEELSPGERQSLFS